MNSADVHWRLDFCFLRGDFYGCNWERDAIPTGFLFEG